MKMLKQEYTKRVKYYYIEFLDEYTKFSSPSHTFFWMEKKNFQKIE